jgi:tRNA-2-methylthio-N6-dimethylallyladenosine synthase
MLAVQQQVSMEHNSRLIGQTVEVMVEGESKLISRQKRGQNNVELGWDRSTAVAEVVKTQLVGRTRGDQVVCFDGDASLKGQILKVKITRAQNLTLFGQLTAPAAASPLAV